jgi:tRNA(fMet)-specific endonuclease VapC
MPSSSKTQAPICSNTSNLHFPPLLATKRGLKYKGATRQLQRFATFCQHSLVFAITDNVLDRAADLWVTASRAGAPRKDADLIIAATALEHGRAVVTGNTADFAWIPGLTVENWRLP